MSIQAFYHAVQYGYLLHVRKKGATYRKSDPVKYCRLAQSLNLLKRDWIKPERCFFRGSRQPNSLRLDFHHVNEVWMFLNKGMKGGRISYPNKHKGDGITSGRR